MDTLISVIIPIYNAEKYLNTCIKSICNQTYKNLEIILVDDGSTDGSLVICDEYAGSDSRIKVIHKENGGQISARKKGLEVATGTYVAFVDSDDWIDIETFEHLTGYLENYESIDMICFGCIEEYSGHSQMKKNLVASGFYAGEAWRCLKNEIFMKQFFFQWGILPHLCDKIIRKTLVEKKIKNVSEDIVYGEDVAVTFPCLMESNTVVVLDETPYHYRQREGSVSKEQRELGEENFKDLFAVLHKEFQDDLSLDKQLKSYMFFALLVKGYTKIKSTMLLFPFSQVEIGNRVLVYGAGNFGKVIAMHIQETTDLELVGWADKNAASYKDLEQEIITPEEILQYEFDTLAIAILDESLCEKIKTNLMELGIAEEKIDYVKKEVIEKEELPVWLVCE